jgi:hypothetical protein
MALFSYGRFYLFSSFSVAVFSAFLFPVALFSIPFIPTFDRSLEERDNVLTAHGETMW